MLGFTDRTRTAEKPHCGSRIPSTSAVSLLSIIEVYLIEICLASKPVVQLVVLPTACHTPKANAVYNHDLSE